MRQSVSDCPSNDVAEVKSGNPRRRTLSEVLSGPESVADTLAGSIRFYAKIGRLAADLVIDLPDADGLRNQRWLRSGAGCFPVGCPLSNRAPPMNGEADRLLDEPGVAKYGPVASQLRPDSADRAERREEPRWLAAAGRDPRENRCDNALHQARWICRIRQAGSRSPCR